MSSASTTFLSCMLVVVGVVSCKAQVSYEQRVASGTGGPGNGPQPLEPAVELYNGTFTFEEYPGGSQQPLYTDSEVPVPFYAPTGNYVQQVNISACGTSLPHFHPGVTEINYVLEGEDLIAGVYLSDALGNRATWATGISKGGVLAVPANAIHYAENPGCGSAVLIQVLSGLPKDYSTVPYIDLPGALLAQDAQAMQQTYGLNNEQLDTALNTVKPLFSVNHTCLAACEQGAHDTVKGR